MNYGDFEVFTQPIPCQIMQGTNVPNGKSLLFVVQENTQSPPLRSPPLRSPPLPYIFGFWDPPWQIFTLHPIILKFCMPLLLYEGPQTTKFQPSTPSGTCIFKVSKTPKFAMVYSSTGKFSRACVQKCCVCSLFFFELEIISKVGALPPHPRLRWGLRPHTPLLGPGHLPVL